MLNKALENSREMMLLSVGLFFFVSSGFVFKWYWTDDPLRFVSQQLLHKNGALLVSIVSNPRFVKAVRSMSTSNDPKRKDIGQYVVDRLLQKDARLLRTLTSDLLRQTTIQKVIQRATTPAPQAKDVHGPPAWEKHVKYTIERLLEKDARLLSLLGRQLILATQASPTPSNTPNPFAQSAERISREVIQRFLDKDAALLRKFIQPWLPKKNASSTSSPSANPLTPQVMERLGKYIVDKLLHARARPLRALLQELVGAEAMRLVREARQTLEQVNQQVKKMRVDRLLREVAYETGKGALEGFIQTQSKQEQLNSRKQRQIDRQTPQMRKLISQKSPCFEPHSQPWLAVKKGALHIKLRYRQEDSKQCPLLRCDERTKRLWNWLKTQTQLGFEPQDIEVSLASSCQNLTKTPPNTPSKPSPKLTPRTTPPKTPPK